MRKNILEGIIIHQLFTIKFLHREPKLAQMSERGGGQALGWLVLVKKLLMKESKLGLHYDCVDRYYLYVNFSQVIQVTL